MALPAGQAAVMKTIMCYGDSNTWGCIPLAGPQPPRRYGPAQRWPGVLRRELGDGYWIVEEGLNGRTTVWTTPWSHFEAARSSSRPAS
jgi:lysophospholipase L1-like esterase